MTVPPRRRNPVITRGKKSDRRKQKLDSRKQKSQSANVGFDQIHEMNNEKRKQFLRGNSSPGDYAFISEPPPLFFEKTKTIRLRQRDESGSAILLDDSKFEQGVPADKVKEERILVLKGQKSIVFHGLKKQFNQHKARVKQEARKTDPEVIEKARKREERNRAMAAEEAERKRIKKENEDARLLDEERKKEESARLARLHLEKLQEVSRLMAIQEEKLKSELERKRLEEIEQDHSHKKEIQQNELDSEEVDVANSEKGEERSESTPLTQVQEYGPLETDITQTIDVPVNEMKTLHVPKIERPEQQSVSLPKEKLESNSEGDTSSRKLSGFWSKLWNMARKLLPSRSNSSKRQHNVANKSEASTTDETEVVAHEIDEPVEEIEGQEPEASTTDETEVVAHEIEEPVEEIESQEPEASAIDETEVHLLEIDEPVEEIESQEPEALDTGETEVVAQEIEEPVGAIESQEPEASATDETEIVAHEIDEPVEEIQQSVGEVEFSEAMEKSESNGELDETDEGNEEEDLPEIETGEIILADLRLKMQQEPQPIKYITHLLIERHKLSQKGVNRLIEHVASPFSMCKTMDAKDFDQFIDSLGNQEVSNGHDIWTKIIEIIGPNSVSEEEQVEIYNMFMGDQNRTMRRVKTIAILFHFLPARFEDWWEKDMIPLPVSKKYSNDYHYFKQVDCTAESIEDARLLLCACGLEKPTAVANRFTYSKHLAGESHESDTEKWLKRAGRDIEYITQNEIPNYAGKKYGSKHVSSTVTPDILLKNPIQLTKDGQHIHWIDAKNHFIDPALSPDNLIDDFCGQLEKYVRRYGPGLIVWGKKFSEEWNEATEGVVQHIKI